MKCRKKEVECQSSVEELRNEVQEISDRKKYQEVKLKECQEEFEKLKLLIEQKGYARKRRENLPTTSDIINSSTHSVKYRRREETKSLLEYIHGGKIGSLYGAWDYLKYSKEGTNGGVHFILQERKIP